MYNTTHDYRKTVAQTAILSGVLALASIYFLAAGLAFHFEAFSDPAKVLTINSNVQFLKWGMVLDMLGYYLLLLPTHFYFKNYLKAKTPWYQFISWCGSAYIFLGALGAAILAAVSPQILEAYPISTAAEQLVLKNEYLLIMQMVHGGMWNTLEILLAGAWWLGIGLAIRCEKPGLGYVSLLLAMACFADGIGSIIGLNGLAETGLNIYLVLAIVWAIWFAVDLLSARKAIQVAKPVRKKVLKDDLRLWTMAN